MRRTHVFDLYRQSGAPAKDAHGRKTGGWSAIATGLPGNYQSRGRKLLDQAQGREVQVHGDLFIHPSELPEGTQVQTGDGVVFTAGRTGGHTTYRVVEASGLGERTEPWDDELVLEKTNESIP